ncbi:MAG: hypothetical protein QM594_00970 [Niabella sp.]
MAKVIFSAIFILGVILCCNLKKDSRMEKVNLFFNAISQFDVKDSNKLKRYLVPVNDSVCGYLFTSVLPLAQKDIASKNMKDFKTIKYKNLKKAEQSLLPNDDISISDIYVVKYKKEAYMFVLFSDDKIKTFLTVNKGGSRFFLYLQ